jgi:hypothetical protein
VAIHYVIFSIVWPFITYYSQLCGPSLRNILNSTIPYSRDIAVNVATRLRAGYPRNYCSIPAGKNRLFSFQKNSDWP